MDFIKKNWKVIANIFFLVADIIVLMLFPRVDYLIIANTGAIIFWILLVMLIIQIAVNLKKKKHK